MRLRFPPQKQLPSILAQHHSRSEKHPRESESFAKLSISLCSPGLSSAVAKWLRSDLLSGSGYSSLIVSNRGAYIQRAILIRCQDYRKALPTADAILSMEESERILQAELCDKIPKRNLKKTLRIPKDRSSFVHSNRVVSRCLAISQPLTGLRYFLARIREVPCESVAGFRDPIFSHGWARIKHG